MIVDFIEYTKGVVMDSGSTRLQAGEVCTLAPHDNSEIWESFGDCAPTPKDVAFKPLKGIKHDHGKPRPDLILHTMARAVLEVSKVAAFGAEKYDDDNWLLVDGANRRYADAKARHMLQGAIESHDKESGLLHAAHEAWNALALLELKLRERLGEVSADDRIDAIGQNED